MTVELPYGTGVIPVDIPDGTVCEILEPAEPCGSAQDARSLIRNATENPLGSSPLTEFLNRPGSLLVIVNDATRPTPTAEVIDALADQLDGAGAEFLVATGAHRAPDLTELEYIFGTSLNRFAGRIFSHNARSGKTDYYGTTERGTEVRLNGRVGDAGKILIIGSVEPHYFAGFTGGRKGLLPGVAAYESIEKNHSLALSPEAAPLKLSGNPVHEDLAEASRLVDKDIFSVMTVLDRSQRICAVTAGGLDPSFEKAAEIAAGVFSAPFSEKADLVIACAKYPMDIDLYQSQKALEHAKLAVKPGGRILLVSTCRDGIGDDAFSRLLSSCGRPDEVYRMIKKGYKLGYHKAARLADLFDAVRVSAFTELDDSILESVFIEPVADLQSAVDELLSGKGRTVLIVPDASVTVPVRQEKASCQIGSGILL